MVILWGNRLRVGWFISLQGFNGIQKSLQQIQTCLWALCMKLDQGLVELEVLSLRLLCQPWTFARDPSERWEGFGRKRPDDCGIVCPHVRHWIATWPYAIRTGMVGILDSEEDLQLSWMRRVLCPWGYSTLFIIEFNLVDKNGTEFSGQWYKMTRYVEVIVATDVCSLYFFLTS